MPLLLAIILVAAFSAASCIICFTLGLAEAGLCWLWDVSVRGRRLDRRGGTR